MSHEDWQDGEPLKVRIDMAPPLNAEIGDPLFINGRFAGVITSFSYGAQWTEVVLGGEVRKQIAIPKYPKFAYMPLGSPSLEVAKVKEQPKQVKQVTDKVPVRVINRRLKPKPGE